MNVLLLWLAYLLAMSTAQEKPVPVEKEPHNRTVSYRLGQTPPKVTVTYLGTAGWEITDGRTIILIDPYLSRLRRARSEVEADSLRRLQGDPRHVFGPDEPLVSDTAIIDAHIKRADLILVHHSHFDHLMDVPYIARKTRAVVVGTQSTTNAARASGVPNQQLVTVRGGEDYQFGDVSVRVIPSLHSPLDGKHYYQSGIIPATVKAPLSWHDYIEGGSFAYLIRIGGRQILTFGSMNYIEREMEGLRPDVALVGAGPSRRENYDYAGRLMRALSYPRLVLPTHWDDYGLPLTDARSTQSRSSRMTEFMQEIRLASPTTDVVIPRYFEPIVVPARPREVTRRRDR